MACDCNPEKDAHCNAIYVADSSEIVRHGALQEAVFYFAVFTNFENELIHAIYLLIIFINK